MYETKPEVTINPHEIQVSSEEIFIDSIYDKHKLISIHLLSGEITEVPKSILNTKPTYTKIKAKAILGIIRILSIDFLLYVKSALKISTINNSEVCLIKEVDMLPITTRSLAGNLSYEISSYQTGIKDLLTLGFFYSFGYDLTSSRQKQEKIRAMTNINDVYQPNKGGSSSNSSNNIFETVDKRFFFNYQLCKRFFINDDKNTNTNTNDSSSCVDGVTPINPHFIVPIICGYVNDFTETIDKKQFKFTLISRRSTNHAGTRYNTRGIDDNGNVANYCEIEQILECDNTLMSFVQVRGSVPVFFRQVGLTASTEITRNTFLTTSAYKKHISSIQKDYSMIFCINLLNVNKPGEHILTGEYERQIKQNDNKLVRYYFFDMQNECKNDNYDRIEYLMDQVDKPLEIFQFFCYNTSKHEIHKNQSGTIRTNCLDCLDRTNVIQTRISWNVLRNMLNSLNINTELIHIKDSFFKEPRSKIEVLFKDMWADNGDYISLQYAGTASTITTITKKGEHDLMGIIQHGVATVTRAYKGSFKDNFKQECIDLFLQKQLYNETNTILNPYIENELRKMENKYMKYEDMLIYVGTWNVGGKDFRSGVNLYEWLLPSEVFPAGKDNKLPDIYIIGFQEIVDLNAQNIMVSSNKTQRDKWKELLTECLNSFSNKNVNGNNYVLVKEIDLIGIYCLTFVKAVHIPSIKHIDMITVKSGLMGSIGNKGSCMLRFNVNDASFAIACCHLSAGKENVESRRNEVVDIMLKAFSKYPDIKFKDYDYFFFFGDVNSRINLDKDECMEYITQRKFNELLTFDQFNVYKKETSVISQLEEGCINFAPTYKYVYGSENYNLKKRTPSWCDRIFYKKGAKVDVVKYGRCEYTLSDHKPIYGVYNVKTWIVDQNEKEKIIRNLSINNESNITGGYNNTLGQNTDLHCKLLYYIHTLYIANMNEDYFVNQNKNKSITNNISKCK